jgi:hypothetical protein
MGDMMKQCREHCQATSRSVDHVLKTTRDARESNDPAKMRAPLDQIEKPLSDMREHMNMCMTKMMDMMEKMGAMGGMMGGRGGMMQSEQPGTGGAQAQRPSAGQLDIAFTTQPTPPRSGENMFEVTVKDAGGKPVPDADVSIALRMPKMGPCLR